MHRDDRKYDDLMNLNRCSGVRNENIRKKHEKLNARLSWLLILKKKSKKKALNWEKNTKYNNTLFNVYK